MLKCKPGDLCVVISGGDSDPRLAEQLVGRFVTVTRIMDMVDETDPRWEFETPILLSVVGFFGTYEILVRGASESLLQPIRGLPVSKTETKDQEVTA